MAVNQALSTKKVLTVNKAHLNRPMVITQQPVHFNRVVSTNIQGYIKQAFCMLLSTFFNFIDHHPYLLFSIFAIAETGMRAMFYHPYEPIEEENESKLSS